MTAPNINLDPELLSILVCPKCRAEFRVDDEASELVCTNPGCALAYPVRDDIPVLLIDEARETRTEDGQPADAGGAAPAGTREAAPTGGDNASTAGGGQAPEPDPADEPPADAGLGPAGADSGPLPGVEGGSGQRAGGEG